MPRPPSPPPSGNPSAARTRESRFDEQPLLLQLLERLVEEIHRDVGRRLRPLDQLRKAVIQRDLRREAERLPGTRDVSGVVADVELPAGLRHLRLDRAAEKPGEPLPDTG